ncbi:unnamed protein product [Malus baccata var. baccata]
MPPISPSSLSVLPQAPAPIPMAASVQTLQQPFLSLAVTVSSTHPRRRLSAIFLLSLSLAVDFLSPVQGSSVDPQIPSFARLQYRYALQLERITLLITEGNYDEHAHHSTVILKTKNASLSVNKFEVQDTTLMNKTIGKNAPLLNETEENNVHFLWLFCIFWRKKKPKKNRNRTEKKTEPKKNWAEPNRTEILVWFRFWQKTEPIRTEPSPNRKY